MKVVVKIAIFVLGIGGVLYWLGTVLVRPFTTLYAHYRAKRAHQAEYHTDREEKV